MMDYYSNIILSIMFFGIAVWMFRGVMKTGDLIYKDKLWNVYRILFAAAGALCLLTGLLYTSVLDWVRLGAMLLSVAAFLMLRDGISETGIAVMGRVTPFDQIRAYDYTDYKKSFRVIAVPEDDPNSKVILTLPQDQKEEVIAFLKKKMGKKYTRMKKG